MYFYISIPSFALIFGWVDYIYSSSQPAYDGGPAEGLGIAIASILTLGLIIGAGLCFMTNHLIRKIRQNTQAR